VLHLPGCALLLRVVLISLMRLIFPNVDGHADGRQLQLGGDNAQLFASLSPTHQAHDFDVHIIAI